MNDSPDEEINILIVDDDPTKRASLKAVIVNRGVRVMTVASGQDALRLLLTHDFAVILLDVNMPIMDGFETAALIHGSSRFQHIPIIFVTSFSTTDVESFKGYGLGAVDYIFAPVVPQVLRAKVTVFTDLYRLRRAALRQAEELVRMNRDLKTEMETRRHAQVALSQCNADLAAANQELESFSYSVSHDLRAPLRIIDGFAHKLTDHLGERLDDEGRRLLDVVRDSTRHMGKLIDDLLAFSRMGRQEMVSHWFDMNAMIQDIANEMRSQEPERVIEFDFSSLPAVAGDAVMLRQVWVNLLGNAIKFTRQRAVARIAVGGERKEDEILFWIKDNGAGFDMQYADKLFGVFQRLHSQEVFEGTGVGLAIVQRILQRHGGRVWGKGQLDMGATFTFALPSPTSDVWRMVE